MVAELAVLCSNWEAIFHFFGLALLTGLECWSIVLLKSLLRGAEDGARC